MKQSHFWEGNSSLARQEIPRLLWNLRSITVFIEARHWILSWPMWIQSMPSHPVSWRSILILSSHLRQSFQNSVSVHVSPSKKLYTFRTSPVCTTFPAHPFLNFVTVTNWSMLTEIFMLGRHENTCKIEVRHWKMFCMFGSTNVVKMRTPVFMLK